MRIVDKKMMVWKAEQFLDTSEVNCILDQNMEIK